MEFLTTCFNELIKNEYGTVYKYCGKTYFSLERIKSLSNIVRSMGTIEEMVITPYYFFGEEVLELYDFTLSIRVVDSLQSKEHYFLEETGKNSIEEIDARVIEKLDNTYYEVALGDIHTFLKSLEHYVSFMNERERNLLITTRDELKISNKKEHGIYYEIS